MAAVRAELPGRPPPHSASPVQCDSRLQEHGLAQQCYPRLRTLSQKGEDGGDQPSANTAELVQGEPLQKMRWGLRRPREELGLAGPQRITPERHRAHPLNRLSRIAGRRASVKAAGPSLSGCNRTSMLTVAQGWTDGAKSIGHRAKPSVLVARQLGPGLSQGCNSSSGAALWGEPPRRWIKPETCPSLVDRSSSEDACRTSQSRPVGSDDPPRAGINHARHVLKRPLGLSRASLFHSGLLSSDHGFQVTFSLRRQQKQPIQYHRPLQAPAEHRLSVHPPPG